MVSKEGLERLEYIIEIGDSRGDLPKNLKTINENSFENEQELLTSEEVMEYTCKILKTYFESMND